MRATPSGRLGFRQQAGSAIQEKFGDDKCLPHPKLDHMVGWLACMAFRNNQKVLVFCRRIRAVEELPAVWIENGTNGLRGVSQGMGSYVELEDAVGSRAGGSGRAGRGVGRRTWRAWRTCRRMPDSTMPPRGADGSSTFVRLFEILAATGSSSRKTGFPRCAKSLAGISTALWSKFPRRYSRKRWWPQLASIPGDFGSIARNAWRISRPFGQAGPRTVSVWMATGRDTWAKFLATVNATNSSTAPDEAGPSEQIATPV